jgi:signal transduction histidine kinase
LVTPGTKSAASNKAVFLRVQKRLEYCPAMPDSVTPNPPLNKKQTVIILQWMIVIVSSYLMLFGSGKIAQDPLIYVSVVILLSSALAPYRFPEKVFYHKFFDPSLLILDTLLIAASIYMGKDAHWDLFLIFFLVLFLTAIGQSLLRVVLGALVISIVYIGLTLMQDKKLQEMGPETFIPIPFLFGVSILYGHLIEGARIEKLRAEMLEERERLKMDLVAALAHDIKNPLGVIMGYAETVAAWLEQRQEGKENLEPLQRIQDNAQRIVKLVTGFSTPPVFKRANQASCSIPCN